MYIFAACAAGFFFIAAPIYLEKGVQVLLNGKPFSTAQQIGGVWAIPLEDFAKGATGTPNLGPNFQIQGNRLVAVGAPHPSSSADTFAVNRTNQANVAAPGAIILQNNAFHFRKAGEVSSRLLTLNGKTFVPLADVAKAGGGIWTPPANVAPGQTFTLNFAVNGDGVIALGH
jgi:hypothetical protein